jgi:hypothetical protein
MSQEKLRLALTIFLSCSKTERLAERHGPALGRRDGRLGGHRLQPLAAGNGYLPQDRSSCARPIRR